MFSNPLPSNGRIINNADSDSHTAYWFYTWDEQCKLIQMSKKIKSKNQRKIQKKK